MKSTKQSDWAYVPVPKVEIGNLSKGRGLQQLRELEAETGVATNCS